MRIKRKVVAVKDYLLWVPVTKLDIVISGWNGISFISVATASATQRYKDISLPLHRTYYHLQKLEKNSPQNIYDAEISDIIT